MRSLSGLWVRTARCLPALPFLLGLTWAADLTPRPAPSEAELVAILGRSSDVARECEACRQLQVTGTPACLPALATALRREPVGHAALNTLAQLPYPEVGATLRRALPGVTGGVRLGLIELLGVRRDEESVPLLVPLLASADPALGDAAARALGRIGSDAAVVALEALPPPLRLEVAHGLLASAELRHDPQRAPEAARLYRRLSGDGVPEPVRSAAWSGLLRLEPGRQAERLTAGFLGSYLPFRLAAFQHLRERPDRATLDSLLGRWPDLSSSQRIAVMDADLSSGAEAAPTLNLALRDADPAVRRAALAALATTGHPAWVPVLVTAAAGDPSTERDAARSSLARLTGVGVDDALTSALATSSVPEAREILRALGERAAPTAAAQLLGFATNADDTLAYAAQRALVRLNDPSALSPLLELAFNTSIDSRRRPLIQAAANLCAGAPDRSETNRIVFALLRRVPADQQAPWFELLPALSTADAAREAESRAFGPDPAVARSAVLALARWPDATPVPTLLRLATRDLTAPLAPLALRSAIALVDREPLVERRLVLLETLAPWLRTEEEKLLLLGQVRRIGTPAGARLVASFLADPEVAERAAADLTDQIEANLESARRLATMLLPEVVKISSSSEVQERARALQARLAAPTRAAPSPPLRATGTGAPTPK